MSKEGFPLTSIAGAPWWVSVLAYIGVPSLLVFYLLGAIPGVSSPIDRIITTEQATAAGVAVQLDGVSKDSKRLHDRELRVLEAICYRLPERQNAPPCVLEE